MVSEPDMEHPVASYAELSPRKVLAGETLDLVVHVKTAPTWHIYATKGSKGPGIPTALKLEMPKGINPKENGPVRSPAEAWMAR